MLFHQIKHLLRFHLTRISSLSTHRSGGLVQSITVCLSATVSQYVSANLEEAGIGDRFMGLGANLFFQRNRFRQRDTWWHHSSAQLCARIFLQLKILLKTLSCCCACVQFNLKYLKSYLNIKLLIMKLCGIPQRWHIL